MVIQLKNIRSKIYIEDEDPLRIFPKMVEYMAVAVPGAYFSPLYKAKKWDGKKRFITPKGYFNTGLLPIILTLVKDLGADVKILDERENSIEVGEILYNLNGEISLRDYQQEILKKILSRQKAGVPFYRGIIDAATNSGKDYIMAGVYRNIKQQTLIVIHNQDIYRKAIKFMGQFFDVGRIDSDTIDLKELTICMEKTLLNRIKKDINIKNFVSKTKCLMVDECHRAAGKEYKTLISKIDSPIKLGFSGTATDMENKVSRVELVGLFGTKIAKISNQFLIEGGHSQKPKVTILKNGKVSYGIIDFRDDYEQNVMFSDERAELIIQECIKRNHDQILISINEIEHGNFLLRKLLLSGIDRVVDFVHGEDKERELKQQKFRENKINVLITSMILKEGVNIPNINTLIMAQGGKSVITVKQLVGRVLRDDGEADYCEVIDFYDYGKYTSSHSKKRIKVYKDEGFDIRFEYEASKLGVPK